jgi:hypothetical protein
MPKINAAQHIKIEQWVLCRGDFGNNRREMEGDTLYHLMGRAYRFGELKRVMTGILWIKA